MKKEKYKCICKGNWRNIVNENEHLIGRRFKDHLGRKYSFFGIVHGGDDYYYGMSRIGNKGITLLSCVGDFECHSFELIDEDDPQT